MRTRVRRSYLVIFLIEIVLFMAIFQFGWLEFRFLSYKKLLMAYWIPYVLSFSLISRPYAYQNLFVAGMQGIYTTTIHALSMNLVLLFIPRSAFFTYLPIHLVLYTALYVLFSPLLLVFFDRIFLKYRSLPLLAFWKYCAWLPILLSMYSGVLSLEDGPLAHDYFLPRIFHALSGIFIALIMYMGTKLIAQQVDLQRRNHLLAAQMDALSNYTSLLQDAQKRMSIFRHDSRHQLRLLSELISQDDDKATLAFLKTIDTELSQTQLQQWTKNQAINTAITPGLERLKQDGVSIMADLPSPPPRPCPLKSPWATSWPKPLPCRPRPSSPCRKTSACSSSGRRPYTAACWSSLNMPYHRTSRTTKTTSSGKRPMPSCSGPESVLPALRGDLPL